MVSKSLSAFHRQGYRERGRIMKKALLVCGALMLVVVSAFFGLYDMAAQAASEESSTAKEGAKVQPGGAKGTLTIDGKTIEMTNAYAFVDQKDKRKPVLLLISDRAVPAEQWKNESDLDDFRRSKPFVYICFWLDKDREDFRREHFVERFPVSTMGIFNLKLRPSPPNTFVGIVVKDGNQVSFSAVLKQ
jgi:hypothetical protein